MAAGVVTRSCLEILPSANACPMCLDGTGVALPDVAMEKSSSELIRPHLVTASCTWLVRTSLNLSPPLPLSLSSSSLCLAQADLAPSATEDDLPADRDLDLDLRACDDRGLSANTAVLDWDLLRHDHSSTVALTVPLLPMDEPGLLAVRTIWSESSRFLHACCLIQSCSPSHRRLGARLTEHPSPAP